MYINRSNKYGDNSCIDSEKLCSLAAAGRIGAPNTAREKYLFILGIRAEMPNSYIYKAKREINKPNG